MSGLMRGWEEVILRLKHRSALKPACKAKKPAGSLPPLETVSVGSFAEYRAYAQSMEEEYRRRESIERRLAKAGDAFTVSGFCCVCRRLVPFWVDLAYGFEDGEGHRTPNWRERLVCPGCGLNNRMRAAFHLFLKLCRPAADCSLYLTEQTTRFSDLLKRCFPKTVGSEFLGPGLEPGSLNAQGTRHEDLTNLSFASAFFDFVLSFDVFEHIPGHRQAFRECRRVLRPGGTLFFTVPFDIHSPFNIVRAEVLEDGRLLHRLPPEYHGDPLREEGCLCFRHFGWECLEELRAAGFSEASCHFYWSQHYGYLGGDQFLLVARA
ncbi:class I SAM-dependent methyltransferase [Desulfoglaeba alkanexedens ALDC]|uniref:Class I SAM-dependent methyltransferase n=2 Tax=Desulfoglaeba alkanexedens TaxID=361111 RepID=A0A4P8L319_9BACT|nr:class I SAM-dependent methyltransferase [Desulfoglaeba alkanexedens ALDC]